jgi:hypothetical protein
MGWGDRARLGLLVCALAACRVLQSGPDPDAPTPWLWGAHARGGFSSVHEDLADEADTPGTAAGFQAFAAYQLARRFAAGLAVDGALAFHGGARYPVFALALVGRSELPHLTLSGWASWYVGNRLVDSESGAEVGLQGPGGGLAVLWRLQLRRARVLEVGPFADALWLHSIGDDGGTLEDEDGAGVRALAVGLAAQFVFGGVR